MEEHQCEQPKKFALHPNIKKDMMAVSYHWNGTIEIRKVSTFEIITTLKPFVNTVFGL